jgi:hypothetical protein
MDIQTDNPTLYATYSVFEVFIPMFVAIDKAAGNGWSVTLSLVQNYSGAGPSSVDIPQISVTFNDDGWVSMLNPFYNITPVIQWFGPGDVTSPYATDAFGYIGRLFPITVPKSYFPLAIRVKVETIGGTQIRIWSGSELPGTNTTGNMPIYVRGLI